MGTTQRPVIPLDIHPNDDMVRVMHRDLLRGVQAILSTVLPSLRVVALTYTGLGGVAALLLVVGVAVMPKQPILQQVTEPARQAVTSFTVPAVELIGRPSAQVAPPPTPAPTAVPFMATVTIDVTIDDAEPVVEEPVVEPEPTVAPVPVARRVFVPAPPVEVTEEAAVDEEQPEDVVEEPAPVEATPTQTAIVEPAAPMLQIASAEAPKALPSPPTSPQEAKARADAANQAAIDAAKAAQAQAKAEADAANQAAIDARKRAQAEAKTGPALSDADVVLPTPTPTSTPTQAARAEANVANQTAIESSKAAKAQAKAEADAANQAAIDAAKAAKASKKP
jgi:hypothetical protein